jgi:hypothetical protein
MPSAGRRNAASGPHATARRYDTRILPDGLYFFLDLPAGKYVLKGQDERGNEIEARQVSIPPADGTGPLHVVKVNVSASLKGDADERPLEARAHAAPARRRHGSRSGGG